jgi:hypothetical protein
VKLYRADVHDPDDGTLVVWGSSKVKCAKAVRKLVRDRKESYLASETIDERDNAKHVLATKLYAVEVPTTREALVKWLNMNFNTDNG